MLLMLFINSALTAQFRNKRTRRDGAQPFRSAEYLFTKSISIIPSYASYVNSERVILKKEENFERKSKDERLGLHQQF